MKTIEQLRGDYVSPIVEAHAECRWCDAGELEVMLNEAFEAGAQAVQEWISVEDELPKDGQYCLIRTSYWNGRDVEYALYAKSFYDSELKFLLLSREVYVEQGDITYWRPIERR